MNYFMPVVLVFSVLVLVATVTEIYYCYKQEREMKEWRDK